METIGKQELWSFADGADGAIRSNCDAVRRGMGHPVRSFLELAAKVAELQYRNRDFVLLFRGQPKDHVNRNKNTSLKPSLLRPERKELNPGQKTLPTRFDVLKRAEPELVQLFDETGLPDLTRLRRQRVLRWAILQHYEVCGTPLLDVTHSLRVAASFATHRAKSIAYLYVIGVPNLSGAITASAEAGLQIIRLASVCPPTALRPHVQEGYLLGEYPELEGISQKELYHHHEVDFGRRLVAKFRLNLKSFWQDEMFPLVRPAALYPTDADDPLAQIAATLQKRIKSLRLP